MMCIMDVNSECDSLLNVASVVLNNCCTENNYLGCTYVRSVKYFHVCIIFLQSSVMEL